MNDLHVYPVSDLIDHEVEGDDCACLPHLESVEHTDGSIDWIVVHNAWDGRD